MRRRYILAGAVVVSLLCGLGLKAQQADSSASNGAGAPDNTNPPASAQPASGTIPRLIKFAGAVKDLTGKVPSGVVSLTFSLYEQPEGGTPLWTESQSLMLDSLGHYTTLLGANSSEGLPLDLFTSSKALWVGVQPQLPGQPELPRVLLVAAPYALKSSDADTLGGLPASAYMLAPNANTAQGGSVTPLIGIQPPGGGGTPPPPPSPGPPSPNPINIPITGTGTANFAAMFTGSSTIGNSPIFSLGGNVGIGTTSPGATLDVHGTGNFSGNVTLSPLNGVNPTFTVTDTDGSTFSVTDYATFETSTASGGIISPLDPSAGSPGGSLTIQGRNGESNGTGAGSDVSVNGGIGVGGQGGNVNINGGQGPNGGNGGSINLTPGANEAVNVNGDLQVSKFISFSDGTTLSTGAVPTLTASSNNFTGGITANSFTGNGAGLTNLTPANISAGTAGINIAGTAATATNALNLGGQPATFFATTGPNTFAGTQTVGSGDLSVTTGNLDLPATTGPTVGVFNLGGTPFLHECCNTGGSLGYSNTFLGLSAGNFIGTGSQNTGIGFNVLTSDTTGSNNTANGTWALYNDTAGSDNTALGGWTLNFTTTGSDNTATGIKALAGNTTGNNNTAVGFQAGVSFVNGNTSGTDFQPDTGSGNTFIGASSGANVLNLSNATAIGLNAQVGESNALVLGCTAASCAIGTTPPYVGIGTSTPQFNLDVNGTANFANLVTFAAGQTFPGVGTVTGVSADSPLSVTNPFTTPTISFTGVLPLANGGTGSSTQNFVDLTSSQTILGTKTFNNIAASGITGSGSGGTISLNATNGDINLGNLEASSSSAGGAINLTAAGGISTGYLRAYGGGGGGDSGIQLGGGTQAGASGSGGSISVSALNGNISVSGDINTSGGGGGGYQTGGSGGSAGSISISASNGDISVSGPVLAAGGGGGGGSNNGLGAGSLGACGGGSIGGGGGSCGQGGGGYFGGGSSGNGYFGIGGAGGTAGVGVNGSAGTNVFLTAGNGGGSDTATGGNAGSLDLEPGIPGTGGGGAGQGGAIYLAHNGAGSVVVGPGDAMAGQTLVVAGSGTLTGNLTAPAVKDPTTGFTITLPVAGCGGGNVPVFNLTAGWGCGSGSSGGGINSVAATLPLTATTTNGNVNLVIQPCPAGEVYEFNATGEGCVAGSITLLAGTGSGILTAGTYSLGTPGTIAVDSTQVAFLNKAVTFANTASFGNGVYVTSTGSTGGNGVYAFSSGTASNGVYGSSSGASGSGINGSASGTGGAGVTGTSASGKGGWGGSFDGDIGVEGVQSSNGTYGVFAQGNLGATGTKPAVVALPDNRVVELYAMESPELWFEDFGSGQLRDGVAEVTLDSTFALASNTEPGYHVFLTPNGDCEGLFVAQKTATGFQVRELRGGKSNISFDYRIVAKRRGYESQRMDQLETDEATVQAIRGVVQNRPAHRKLIMPKPAAAPVPPNAPPAAPQPGSSTQAHPAPATELERSTR